MRGGGRLRRPGRWESQCVNEEEEGGVAITGMRGGTKEMTVKTREDAEKRRERANYP